MRNNTNGSEVSVEWNRIQGGKRRECVYNSGKTEVGAPHMWPEQSAYAESHGCTEGQYGSVTEGHIPECSPLVS